MASLLNSEKLAKRDRVYFQPTPQHRTRAGYVEACSRDGGYALRVAINGTVYSASRVSAIDARRQLRKVVSTEDAEYASHAADWRLLDRDCDERLDHGRRFGPRGTDGNGGVGGAAANDGGVDGVDGGDGTAPPYVALHEVLERELVSGIGDEGGFDRLRLGTFNVCHLNDGTVPEKIRNLAAAIRRSLSDVVVLQEVATGAEAAVADLAEAVERAGEPSSLSDEQQQQGGGGGGSDTNDGAGGRSGYSLRSGGLRGRGSGGGSGGGSGQWGFKLSEACGTHSRNAAGECYALLWNKKRVAAVLRGGALGPEEEGDAAAAAAGTGLVEVQSFMYDRRDTFGARGGALRRELAWGTDERADFSFGGASAARLPAYFRLRCRGAAATASEGVGASSSSSSSSSSIEGGRSLVVATIHTAFSDAETRRRQFRALRSLLPSKPLDCSRCVFALLGDFNSDASNTRGMTSSAHFAQTADGQRVAEEIATRCRFKNVSLHTDATSIGGAHYDEAFVQSDAVGRRHAHVFPRHPRLQAIATKWGLIAAANATNARNANRAASTTAAAAAAAERLRLESSQWSALEVFTPHALRPSADEVGGNSSSASKLLANFKARVFTDHLLVFVDVSFTRAPSSPSSTSSSSPRSPASLRGAGAAAEHPLVVSTPPRSASRTTTRTTITLQQPPPARGASTAAAAAAAAAGRLGGAGVAAGGGGQRSGRGGEDLGALTLEQLKERARALGVATATIDGDRRKRETWIAAIRAASGNDAASGNNASGATVAPVTTATATAAAAGGAGGGDGSDDLDGMSLAVLKERARALGISPDTLSGDKRKRETWIAAIRQRAATTAGIH